MKSIPMRTDGDLTTITVLREVCQKPGAGRGINVEEMRRRFRILEAIEKAEQDNELSLEDADHALLVGLYRDFQFGLVNERVLEIADDLDNAK